MTSNHLPDRPNLEQLKKLAKTLLHAAQARDPAALRRFAALPRARGKSADERAAFIFALHDAQSVIAREHGFASWNALREEVEARTLSFDGAVDEFIRCAADGASGRAERLLALHPRDRVRVRLTRRCCSETPPQWRRACASIPSLRRKPGGPQNWEPLLYACHTCMHKGDRRPVGWPGRNRTPAVLARRESECRVPLELASGAPANGAVGRGVCGQPPAARRGAARGGRQSNGRRHRRTSRVAAAISPRSSCCIDSVFT